MLARFERLSLRIKLALGFSAVIGLMLAAAVIAMVGHETSIAAVDAFLDNEDRISDLSLESRAAMEKARRYEKEFLIKVHVFSFEESKSRYATLVASEVTRVRENLATIRQLAGGADSEGKSRIIEAAAQQYLAGFLRVVALYGRLGRIDTGQEGALRSHAHGIEALLADGANERLRIDLLTLRRHEKDFILRGQVRYAAAFDDAARQFLQDLALTGLQLGQRQALQRPLEQYQAAFHEYVATATEIDATTLTYLTAAHQIEPQLDQLRARADAAMGATRATIHAVNERMTLVIVGGGAVAMMLAFLVARYIVRNANQSIQATVRFAGRLAAGDWTARVAVVQGRNEFSRLAAALNTMADAMQVAYQRERRHSAELTQLNRTLRLRSECDEALIHSSKKQELLETICGCIVQTAGHALAWVGLVQQDVALRITIAAHACRDAPSAGMPDAAECDRCAMVVRDDRLLVARRGQSGDERGALAGHAWPAGTNSCLVLPLRARGQVLGGLTIYSSLQGAFDDDEVRLLQELANDLAFGIMSLRETRKLEAAELALDYQINHDTLTGLANRDLFSDRLRQAILQAARNAQQVAVIVLTLDRYKAIEDGLGHEAGDIVLQHTAAVLTGVLREGDTIARLSQDEFALALNIGSNADDIMAVALKLLQSVQQPITMADEAVFSTVSMGVSLFPKDGAEGGALVRCAKAALLSAQAMGGDRFRFYSPEMNERSTKLFKMEADLRRALEQDELRVHYQPRVNLASGEMVGAEALVRWQHPVQGMIPPGEFIELAENTGLIIQLGAWVIADVCRQQRAWIDAGLPVLPVAVNLSPRQFRETDLPQQVRRALQEHRLEARLLEMEVTESTLMEDVGEAMAMLNALKAIGIQLSLDDFGTGHSSLSRLRHLPIDHLKIDQSFVRNLTTDPADAAICNAIINLAHNLHMTVIAEGVETAGQANYLRQNGCDEMQGYLFAKPMASEDYAALLARKPSIAPALLKGGAERTLLLVDDEPHILSSLQRLLRRDGYKVLSASSARAGFELLSVHNVQVILSDQRMPEMNGTEFFARVSELYPDTIRIVLSGYTDASSVTESVNRGAIYKFLSKPWTDQDLRSDVKAAFQRYDTAHRRA
jgi:diguanylate cyclase (GGDEF)-like protein